MKLVVPLNHLDDEVDPDQPVFNQELALCDGRGETPRFLREDGSSGSASATRVASCTLWFRGLGFRFLGSGFRA